MRHLRVVRLEAATGAGAGAARGGGVAPPVEDHRSPATHVATRVVQRRGGVQVGAEVKEAVEMVETVPGPLVQWVVIQAIR
jgi:hypothetical protein